MTFWTFRLVAIDLCYNEKKKNRFNNLISKSLVRSVFFFDSQEAQENDCQRLSPPVNYPIGSWEKKKDEVSSHSNKIDLIKVRWLVLHPRNIRNYWLSRERDDEGRFICTHEQTHGKSRIFHLQRMYESSKKYVNMCGYHYPVVLLIDPKFTRQTVVSKMTSATVQTLVKKSVFLTR